jgi:hypothetical protein
MFGFFKKDNNACPLSEETRVWLENSLIWLINQFGEQKLLSVTTLLPTQEHFPVKFDGTEQMARDIMAIVARQMDVDANGISLDFYNQQLLEITGDGGFTLYGQPYEDESYSAGQYAGKDENNKFSIAIELGQLKKPEDLVATFAHEIAHIKLLGEGRMEENHEDLTDLVTVFFGLGVFNANSAFRFHSDANKWSYSKQGYLPQQEWAYALALYAYIRQEKNPAWIKFLSKNIQSDFKKSEAYIYDNTDKVLM